MPEGYLDAKFPLRGIDLSAEVSGQGPLTTPIGINVRAFDPSTDRGRGAARPGTTKLPAGLVPTGTGLIQHLNTVITTDSTNVPLGIEDPGAPTIDDPSSPGDVGLWGTDPLYIDPDTGNPVTGADLGSRVPAPPGQRPKRRRRGSGFQPNPNQLTQAPPAASPRGCFQGNIEIVITKPAPDPLHWTGQRPFFNGCGCVAYNPPLVPAPVSAEVIPVGHDDPILGTPGSMSLVDYIKVWLSVKVGSDAFGTVTADYITNPAVVTSGGCTGLTGCSAAPPSVVPTGSAVGTIITAA